LDQKFRRELKRLASVFGLEERFLWLDWLEDTASLFAALDIFISASHTESFGLAILEAMASGTPVVATETAGARELIADNKLLVPVKDPVKLAETIIGLLRDESKRGHVAKTLAARAAEKYSVKRMVDATEQLYAHILNGR